MVRLKFGIYMLVLSALATSCTTLPTTQGESDEIFFLQDAENEGVGGDTALLEGMLSLANGCLLITDQFGIDHSPVWPRGYTYETVGNGIEIYNHADEAIARVGEKASLGGGEFSPQDYENIDKLLGSPSECPRPFWSVNGASPL